MNAKTNSRIYYFCPDIRIQSAGIRRLYRHVDLLRRAGFKAHILHQHDGFQRRDLPGVPVGYLDRQGFDAHDILVIPEGCPTVMAAVKDHSVRRFVIALNWDYVFKSLPAGVDWRAFNIERVLTVSPVIAEMITWSMGLPTHVLGSSIDHGLYFVDDRAKKPCIVFISRKSAQVDVLKRLLGSRNPDFIRKIQWLGLDGLAETTYAARIREASIFLNLSGAEGHPTSCLEAMASGTLVAGYDSVGGRELLRGSGPDQNCLLAPMGDYVSLAYALEPVLKGLLREGRLVQSRPLLASALQTAEGFTPEAEYAALISFWRAICVNQAAAPHPSGPVRMPMTEAPPDHRQPTLPGLEAFSGIESELSSQGLHALACWLDGARHDDAALEYYQKALDADPGLAEAHYNMGLILQQMGQYERGLSCFQKALACNPAFAPARWLYLLSLPRLYDTPEQIDQMRRRFTRNLDELVDSVKLATPFQIQYALQGIRTATNFYLQYQGRDDLELQKKYGRLVQAVMSARYPQWAHRPAAPATLPAEPIRIGYVSSFMCRHTVGSFLAGWLENHDHAAFRIHCYHVGDKIDDLTAHFRRISHDFHHFAGDVEAAAARIAADRLHILVYSDIGMNTETLQLAALRLAPVQCKGWGHPVTTGLPTIDYYLSSDLMEPGRAQQYYSETLVRLPNLALCYHPPQMPSAPLTRKALGIPEDRFIFLSPQSLFKYLPQHDEVYPLIARQADRACFVFISHQSPYVTRRFRERLHRAFARYGLDADRFCCFSPRLHADGFLSLNLAADVLLDTFDWSGGKTTLEALSSGLPVVTCPGRFMRGRHAYAMLTRMGLSETIARDRSEYCQIAVRLAIDGPYHESVRARFKTHRQRLYHDKEFISALEDFYRSLVGPQAHPAPAEGRPASASVDA
jgi:tetratricopeptide (TPR) repeat protein